ncbi:MAG: gliding motility-associated C-terminal domain-containing protein [Bacteroidetes bacterium]|nr:gliding motility-associated C-terminal domain-containing protein [Bacteroidota bacterium]
MMFIKNIQCLLSNIYFLAILISLDCLAIKSISSSAASRLPPCGFTLNTSSTSPSCNAGTNGTAIITVSSGSGNYSYSWSEASQTGQAATNLSASTYTVTVTDNVAVCTATATVTVTQPLPVINSTTGQSVSCFGYNDGKAWVTPTVAVPQPSYAWSGTTEQNDTLSGLTIGNYTVTVTDNSGCSQSAVISITQPSLLGGTVTSTNSTCNGANNGTATIAPSGGTLPYTYSWNSSPAQATVTATGLGPGTFTIKLSDAKGCEFYYSVNISEAAPLVINNPVITKETCQLGNGKVTISLIGGTPPYTYSWSPPANLQTTSAAINLSAGTYTVTVTDSKGCTAARSAVVTNQFIPPDAIASTVNDVTCFGAANGRVTVLASAGTTPYAYVWSPTGGVAATASGLSPNTYTVVVTDANGCTATSSATITQPAAMSLNPSSVNVTCGLTDGSASVAPAGGTQPYNVVWSNAATGYTAANLGAGTYTVTVTDAGPCTLTASVTIIISNPLIVTTGSTNITCNGNANGTASASASGGSGTFNYSWNPGGYANSSITNLSPAVYTLTVTDGVNVGCTATKTVNITQPGILIPAIAGTNVTCNGLNNGKATSTPTGGTSPYTYVWNTGSATNSTSGLAPGTYSLTVTDSKSCTAVSTVAITQSAVLAVIINTQTNVACSGGSTGSASVIASGGTGTLTYTWAPSGGTSATATARPAGNYTVTVRDANNCSATVVISITQPAAITTTPSVTPSSCGVSGGSATVTPAGGISPYTYSWSSGITANTSTVAGLSSATYTITVRDANACSKTQTLTIAVSNPLAIVPGKTNLTCNGSANGQIGVTVTGGTGSYNYIWTPGGATASTISGLTAGTYTVTVRDAVNSSCSATSAVAITQPALLNVTLTPQNIVCFGQTNGRVTAAASGGVTGYTYSWAPVAGAGNVISNLSAGIYTLTLTDANACTTTKTATVAEPPPLTLTMTKKNVTCIGTYDGGVRGKVTGGTPLYTYNWLPAVGVTDTIGGLGPGTYKLTITDANGCTKVDSAKITEPPAFSISTGGVNPTCYNSDGSVYVSVVGGSGSFSYSWIPSGSTGTTVSGLSAGSYQVRVTDISTGCDTLGTMALTYPAVALAMSSTNVTCKSYGNGIVSVVASGAAAPYTYLWSAGSVTNSAVTGLSPGAYTVTVNDAGGCVRTGSISITEPLILSLSKTSVNVSCFNGNNGTASITAAGGTAAYTYSWSSTQTTNTITGLTAGKYFITLTDQKSCTKIDSVQIAQPAALVTTTASIDVSCNGQGNGRVSVSLIGGTAPYTYTWNPGTILNDTIYNIGPGTYSVTVNDSKGCSVVDNVSVSQPSAITVTMNSTSAGCGSNTGTADAIISGGVTPYTYTWSTGSTSASVINLLKGTYTVTVSDKMGCLKISTVVITEPTGITISFSSINISCNGANDGQVTATASGGTGTYSYSWTPLGTTSATYSALSAGTYTVVVADAVNSNCSAQSTVTITEPVVLSSAIAQTGTSCFGIADGNSTVTVSGGSPAYTYSWSNGASNVTAGLTFSITGLTTQTYSVSITDGNGCTTSQSVSITQPATINSSAFVKQASCGKSDGKIWVTATGGTGLYTYSWSPLFGITDTLKGLSAGTFYVVVTDANGCSQKDTAEILLSTVIKTKLSQVPATCYGRNNGQVIDTVSGGSGAYLYNWSPGGSTNPNPINLTPGMYTVTVSDAALVTCFKIDSILVTEPPAISINPAITKTACTGNNNYVATANVSGGTPGYLYTWSFGGTNPVESNLSPGTYVLQVQDSNGCDTAAIFSITGSSTPFILPPSVVNPKCNFPNGSIAISIFGGATPYSYSWGPSVSVSDSAKNVSAGIYSLTVTDAYNCTNTRTITVVSSSLPPNLIMSGSSAGCYGASTGSASAVAKAGSPPYTYSWSPSGTTTATITGQSAGTYIVTVTDSKSCTVTGSASISEPSAITLAGSSVDASCDNSNGSASVSPAGGTPGYTYSWSNGSSAQTISNVLGGNYMVTVTDNNGCTKTMAVVVNTTNSLTVSVVAADILCYSQSTGSASASITGGTPNFTYSWSNGATSATAANLAAGNYSVTVTDQNGCSSTQTATVTEPVSPVTLSVTSVNAICGKSDGSVTVIANGGTPGYSYSWNSGPTSAGLTGISAGNYTVTVTDINGCGQTAAAVVTNANGPSISINVPANVLCFGKATGEAVVNVTGGTPAYTYNWNNGATGATAAGLTAGAYTITVTDQNGCSTTQAASITQPADSVAGIITVTNAMCGTGDGIVTIAVSGGIPVYTYSWSQGSTAATISGLTGGIYSVTVTDNNGCSINTSATVITMPGILLNIMADSTTCAETTDGKIKIVPISGTPVYTYSWSNGSTLDSIVNLADGTYSVTITDAIGCQMSTSVAITFANSTPVADFSFTPSGIVRPEKQIFFTDLSTSGSSLLWNFGESDPYNNTSTLPDPSHSYYYMGVYCISLVATNTAGCYSSVQKCIEVYADSMFVPNVFTPNNDGSNDLYSVKTYGMRNFDFQIFDRWGLIVFQGGSTSKIDWDGRTPSGMEAPDGTYYYLYTGESLKGKKYQGSGFLELIRGKK